MKPTQVRAVILECGTGRGNRIRSFLGATCSPTQFYLALTTSVTTYRCG